VTSKVTAILMVFRGGDAYSLTEIARLAGLPISTTHRLVGELTARRLLERTEDGDYRIGLPLRMLGPHADHIPPLLDRAHDVMVDLALATGASVRLGVLRDLRIAYVRARPGVAPPSSFSGTLLPAHATALGRALLAFSPAAVVDAVVAVGLPARGAGTLTTPERLRRSLAVTRLTRVAISHGEPTPGRSAVAMPVFGAGGKVLAALEVSVAEQRAGLTRARAALVVATGSLSRQLATAHVERPSAATG
jgi:DNA-binding IclR family transcriptional regulator